jgi:hypothetical protein
MEDVGIFDGHLVYFTAIWYILWPLGIFNNHFLHFGMLYQEKSGNPDWKKCLEEESDPGFGPECCDGKTFCPEHRRRGAVGIASASATEGQGSNPARV